MGELIEEEYTRRYQELLHGVQTGVKQCQELGLGDSGPMRDLVRAEKHLRTGINAVMSDNGALAQLLIEKGVITRLEYLKAIVAGLEREKASYEKRLSAHYGGGTQIHLA